jgi:hypothetical protein
VNPKNYDFSFSSVVAAENFHITSGSDSSESKSSGDLFPAAAENTARNCALTDPIEDEP